MRNTRRVPRVRRRYNTAAPAPACSRTQELLSLQVPSPCTKKRTNPGGFVPGSRRCLHNAGKYIGLASDLCLGEGEPRCGPKFLCAVDRHPCLLPWVICRSRVGHQQGKLAHGLGIERCRLKRRNLPEPGGFCAYEFDGGSPFPEDGQQQLYLSCGRSSASTAPSSPQVEICKSPASPRHWRKRRFPSSGLSPVTDPSAPSGPTLIPARGSI